MQLLDYQKIVEETAVYPSEFGLGYTTLGLMGEMQEFFKAEGNKDITKEFGDVCWYLCASCKEAALHFSLTFYQHYRQTAVYSDIGPRALRDRAEGTLGDIAEIVKKYYRDDTPLQTVMDKLGVLYMNLSRDLCWIAILRGVDISAALEGNYKKLMLRKEKNLIHGSGSNREE